MSAPDRTGPQPDEAQRTDPTAEAGELAVTPVPIPDVPDEVPAAVRRALVPDWVGPVFVLLGLVTIPWVVYLGWELPRRQVAAHYDLAWVGFDVGLVAALIWTGWAAYNGRFLVEMPATMTGTLLVVDAWFDVVTSHTRADRTEAVLLAAVVELPLAAVCLWLARHAETVRTERLHFFRRRAEHLAEIAHDSTSPAHPARWVRRRR